MATLLDCYAEGLDQVADIAGDLDVGSPDSLLTWQVAQWRSLADRLGFRAEIDPALEAAVKTKGQFGSLQNVGVNAFTLWIDARPKRQTPNDYPADKLADLRADTIAAWREQPQSLWRVEKDAASIAGNGCVGKWRAFPTANSDTYFRPALSADPTPRGTCTYNTPIVVYLGTWPWYYGGALIEEAPGFHWQSYESARPAEQAARAMVSAWTPIGNAAIDGRHVVTHYQEYRRRIDPILANLSTEQGSPGSLYRTAGGEIRVSLDSSAGRYVDGSLGPISLRAHNHIMRCFGAFLSLRRAMLRDVAALKPDVISRLKASGDECVLQVIGDAPAPEPTPKPKPNVLDDLGLKG